MKSSGSGNAWYLIKLLVSLGLVGWVVLSIDTRQAGKALSSVHYSVTVGAWLFLVLSQALSAMRWWMLLAALGVRISYPYSLRLTFRGLFASNFLPTTVGGDALKVGVLVSQGHGKVVLASSVVLDRLANLLAVLLLSPALLWVPKVAEPRIVGSIGLAIGLLFASLVVLQKLNFHSVLTKASASLIATLFRFIQSIATATSRLASSPRVMLPVIGLSLASVFFGILTTWIVSCGVGIRIGFIEVIAVVTGFYILGLLPISFNGLGVQDAGLVFMLTKLGSSEGQALALVVLIRLLILGTSLIGAVELIGLKKPNIG